MAQPEQAPVAMAAAEAAWYERDGIDPDEAWQAGAHAGFPAGWAAALQWAAQLAVQQEATYPGNERACNCSPGCKRREWDELPFASLLREEGGGT